MSACSQANNITEGTGTGTGIGTAVGTESGSEQQGTQEPEEGPNLDDKLDYTLQATNGKWYLAFNDVSLYNDPESCDIATLSFDTIKDMKDAIKTGKLKAWQKQVVATSFAKDETRIKVPDLDKPYVPKVPKNGTVGSVGWAGEYYSFSLTLNNSFGVMHVYPAEQHARGFASDYEHYFDRDTITVSNTETLADGKTVTYYSTRVAQLMQVRYVLTEGSKTFTVDKTFRCRGTGKPRAYKYCSVLHRRRKNIHCGFVRVYLGCNRRLDFGL